MNTTLFFNHKEQNGKFEKKSHILMFEVVMLKIFCFFSLKLNVPVRKHI